MKKKYLILLSLFICNQLLSQTGYDRGRLYDFGLPDGKETGDSLVIAIPLLIIGFIICWFTMWSDPNRTTGDNKTKDYLGCGGCLIMVIGGFFLIPLLAWVEAIFSSALGILVVVGIAIAIITAIYNYFNKSNNSQKSQIRTTESKQKTVAQMAKEKEDEARRKRELQWEADIDAKLSEEAKKILYDEYQEYHILDNVHYKFDPNTWDQDAIDAFVRGYTWGCWRRYSFLSITEFKKRFHPLVVLGYLRGLEEKEIWEKYGKFPG